MSADEFDKGDVGRKLEGYDQSMISAADVEYTRDTKDAQHADTNEA
jgi:hypothetical protein